MRYLTDRKRAVGPGQRQNWHRAFLGHESELCSAFGAGALIRLYAWARYR